MHLLGQEMHGEHRGFVPLAFKQTLDNHSDKFP